METYLHETAVASIRVAADPDFDQGLLLGRVYCDANEDGQQNEDEPGFAGAQLYMDTGYRVTTDAYGRFRFKDINPGTHIVKLDMRSVLPGSTLTTQESRIISFTRGLPARVTFGITCPADKVTEAVTAITDEGVAIAMTKWGVIQRDLMYDAASQRVRLGELELSLSAVTAKYELKTADARKLLTIRPKVKQPETWTQWSLMVRQPEGQVVKVLDGEGNPRKIDWQVPEKWPDGAWSYQLRLVGASGVEAGSRWVQVTADTTAQPQLLGSLSGDGFLKGRKLSKSFIAELENILPKVKALTGPFEIAVHFDDTKGPLTARSLTRKRAEDVVDYLVSKGVERDKLKAVGYGGQRPIRPNITDRSRRKNRRVEIIHLGPPMKSLGQTDVRTTEQKVADETQASSTPAQVDAASTSKVDSAVQKQLDASDETRVVKAPKSGQTDRESLAVTLGLESFELHPDAPARRVWLPKSRPLPIRVTAPDGAYAGRIRPAMPMTREQPKLTRRRFEGRLIGNKLDLLGRALSRPIVILKKQAQGSTVKSDKKRFSWRVTSPGTANSWSFSVTDQTGRVLHQENGAGNPPAVLGWRPTEQFAKVHMGRVSR